MPVSATTAPQQPARDEAAAASRTGAARFGLWDATMLVLGLNLWVSLLFVPRLHLEQRLGIGPTALMALPLVLLLAGLLTRNAVTLLAIYPASLLLPVVAAPALVGVNVFSRWTFVLVAVGFVGYTLVSALLLRVITAPAAPERRKRLPPGAATSSERAGDSGLGGSRFRMYIAMGVLSAALPGVLVYALFLDRHVAADLMRFYPERGPTAAVLFGVVAVGLWLALFYAYFLKPLRAHVRGDPELRGDLLRLRRESRRDRPRARFYVWVVLALGAVAYLVWGL